MFYSLTGTVIAFDAVSVALECAGVGFKCFTSINTLERVGAVGTRVTLYTYLSVREDALDLYGFYTQQELSCYKLLISVSGVGPKAALSILSELDPEKLAVCIASGDSKTITRAQGVGPKLAQRIVLELKDKISAGMPDSSGRDIDSVGIVSASKNASEAVSALVVLGYSQSDASVAVAKSDGSMSVNDIIKSALKLLSKGV